MNPKVLSNKPFKEDTYTIVHTQSSLKLNGVDNKHVDENWKVFLEKSRARGGKPFNGAFYRIENIQDIVSGCKELQFSTITYSQVRGIKDDPYLSSKFTANNISTASLIKTIDGYFIFGIRGSSSMRTSRIDLIGGGLQESELVVNTFSDIFKNEVKEIREEVGLIEDDIRDMYGIGILQSSGSNVLFTFFTQLNRSKDEVKEIFFKNNDDEMEDLDFVEEGMLKEYLKDKGDYRPLVGEVYVRIINISPYQSHNN